ncbi:hypothetical protein ZWY2020_028726 [Hordeum vulgare]|nr:hypothetical protein ZWY2020_028726 [Hordeum vulgare]
MSPGPTSLTPPYLINPPRPLQPPPHQPRTTTRGRAGMENPDDASGADAGFPAPPPSLDSAGAAWATTRPRCSTAAPHLLGGARGQGSPHPPGCYSFRAPRKLDAIKQVIMAKASSSVSRTRWLNLVGLVMLR